MDKYNNIFEYISQYDGEVKLILEKTYEVIKAAAPNASEKISYGMPCFFIDKTPLVYFAAMKNHLGFYPTAEGMEAFSGKLNEYKTSKGAVQFPYSKPIPYGMISEITAYRVKTAMPRN